MDIEIIWEKFFQLLSPTGEFEKIEKKKMAGIPFLYVTSSSNIGLKEIVTLIETSAVAAMKGRRLHFELIHVRTDRNLFVFRCRFYVPLEKMFCCGNLCQDCIRFRV